MSLHHHITGSISSFVFSLVLFSLFPRNPERMPRIEPCCLWIGSVIGVWRHIPKHLPSCLSRIFADGLSKRFVLSMDVSCDTLMPCGFNSLHLGYTQLVLIMIAWLAESLVWHQLIYLLTPVHLNNIVLLLLRFFLTAFILYRMDRLDILSCLDSQLLPKRAGRFEHSNIFSSI